MIGRGILGGGVLPALVLALPRTLRHLVNELLVIVHQVQVLQQHALPEGAATVIVREVMEAGSICVA